MLSRRYLDSFFERFSIVRRRRTTSAPKLPAGVTLEHIRKIYLARLAYVAQRKNVPRSLVFCADETGMHLAPAPSTTLDEKGAKNVEVAFADDKRQITGMLGVTLDGHVMPAQLIFEGKTARSAPATNKYPAHISTTVSPNHWANEQTTLEFVDVVVAYKQRVIDKEGLLETTPAMLVWDVFYTHRLPSVLQRLKENNIFVVFVPANTTAHFQLCDVSINKPWKSSVVNSFVQYMADVFADSSVVEGDADVIDMALYKLKTSAPALREKTMDFVHTAIQDIEHRDYIINGARRIGLDTIWDKAWEPVWQALEASGQLWKSFSRHDIVVREGRVQDVAAYAASAEERAEQEDEVANEVTLADEHQRIGDGDGGDSDDGDDGADDESNVAPLAPFTLAGLALVVPAGAAPALLPQFLPPPAPTGAAAASAVADAAKAAAKAAKPAAKRKCTVCGATSHRADNNAFPACYAANKKNAAAKKAAATQR